MDDSKLNMNELDILLLDSISMNEESVELLEMLTEELESGFSLNLFKQTSISH